MSLRIRPTSPFSRDHRRENSSSHVCETRYDNRIRSWKLQTQILSRSTGTCALRSRRNSLPTRTSRLCGKERDTPTCRLRFPRKESSGSNLGTGSKTVLSTRSESTGTGPSSQSWLCLCLCLEGFSASSVSTPLTAAVERSPSQIAKSLRRILDTVCPSPAHFSPLCPILTKCHPRPRAPLPHRPPTPKPPPTPKKSAAYS